MGDQLSTKSQHKQTDWHDQFADHQLISENLMTLNHGNVYKYILLPSIFIYLFFLLPCNEP